MIQQEKAIMEKSQTYKLSVQYLINVSKHLIKQYDLPPFQLEPHTEFLYTLICEYYNNDKAFESRFLETKKGKKYYSLRKGLFLMSRPGTGKTFIFEMLLPMIFKNSPEHSYRKTTAENVKDLYAQEGRNALKVFNEQVYNKFGQAPGIYHLYIDDFGREGDQTVPHFRDKDIKFMDKWIETRYRSFISHNRKTHGSSNLDITGLKDHYTAPTWSRMRQLFNFIPVVTDIDYRDL